MRTIDTAALSSLPATEQEEARKLLVELQRQYEANPLLRYEPHAKQILFHMARVFTKGFFGGNRSGKTTAGICDDIIQAVDRDTLPTHLLPYKKFEPPFHCRIICPSNDIMESVVFQKLREWCPHEQLVGDSWEKAFSKSKRILSFKNGSFFDFLTYEQDLDKFGGAAKHRIHYDEEPPKEIRQEGLMRLADYSGADEIFTMTPQHGLSWMYDEVWEPWKKGQLKHCYIVTVDMDDNPYLSEEQKDIILAGLSTEELEARKKGRFVHFYGMIYPEFERATHVIPEATLPEGVNVYVGIDPGIRQMAAVVWIYHTSDDRIVAFDELHLEGYTIASVCNAIRLVNMKHGKDSEVGRISLVPRWYVIDPAARNIMQQTGRSDQQEYSDNGIVTILGQNAVPAGINRIKERLQNGRLFVTANCPVLIDEFRKYRWASPKRTEGDPKEAPVKQDDHLLDALRYAVASRPTVPRRVVQERRMTPAELAVHREMTGQNKRERPRIEGIPL